MTDNFPSFIASFSEVDEDLPLSKYDAQHGDESDNCWKCNDQYCCCGCCYCESCQCCEWCNAIPICGKKIHPYGPFRVYWAVFTILVLLCACLQIPFILVFNTDLSLTTWQGVFSVILDFFLIVDLMLNFFIAYYDQSHHSRLVANLHRIAKKLSHKLFRFIQVTTIKLCLHFKNDGLCNYAIVLQI